MGAVLDKIPDDLILVGFVLVLVERWYEECYPVDTGFNLFEVIGNALNDNNLCFGWLFLEI